MVEVPGTAENAAIMTQLKVAHAMWPKCKIFISELMTPSGDLGHILQKEKITFYQTQI